jgi:hypothetical protein
MAAVAAVSLVSLVSRESLLRFCSGAVIVLTRLNEMAIHRIGQTSNGRSTSKGSSFRTQQYSLVRSAGPLSVMASCVCANALESQSFWRG